MQTEGGTKGEHVPSAPPAPQNAAPMYPVLNHQQVQAQPPMYANSQQQVPQQQIYQQPQQQVYQQPDESKQLELEIGSKCDDVIRAMTEKKQFFLKAASSPNINTEQKRDLIMQLNKIMDGINMVSIDPSIKPKPIPIQQPIVQKIVYAQAPPQQQVVYVQPQQQNVRIVNDTWNVMTSDCVLNQQLNAIHRPSRKGWSSCFANQPINKGQYKKWDIKILPQAKVKNAKSGIADIVIGICDSNLAKSIGARNGEFWLKPFYGYGFYGYSGKKFHREKKGKNYNKKFSANDTISVELNMQSFDLSFYINGMNCGKAYGVDATRSYVLAVAFTNSKIKYDAQIL